MSNENINCSSFYRKDQIEKLNELWKDDLEYFNYSFEGYHILNNQS